jgi:hypothetical protein
LHGVGVFESIGVAMVSAVVAGPPADRPLYCTAAEEGKCYLDGKDGRVGGVGPESVITFSLVRRWGNEKGMTGGRVPAVMPSPVKK